MARNMSNELFLKKKTFLNKTKRLYETIIPSIRSMPILLNHTIRLFRYTRLGCSEPVAGNQSSSPIISCGFTKKKKNCIFLMKLKELESILQDCEVFGTFKIQTDSTFAIDTNY